MGSMNGIYIMKDEVDMAVNREKAIEHKKGLIVGILIMAIFINGGFFPIINFNPNNPVDLGILMKLIVIVMAFSFHKYIGSLEAILCEKWSVMSVGIFNVSIALCGLGSRYLLEFGEVSNTYNFTIVNVLFQVITLATISTVVCVLGRRSGI